MLKPHKKLKMKVPKDIQKPEKIYVWYVEQFVDGERSYKVARSDEEPGIFSVVTPEELAMIRSSCTWMRIEIVPRK